MSKRTWLQLWIVDEQLGTEKFYAEADTIQEIHKLMDRACGECRIASHVRFAVYRCERADPVDG